MSKRRLKAQSTLGADKGYDVKEFVGDLEANNIKPHIARNITPHRGSAITDEIAAEPGYEVSLRIRKRIEQVFGWSKTVGHLRKTQLRGLRHPVIDDVCSLQLGETTKIAMPAPDSGAGIGRGAPNDLGKA